MTTTEPILMPDFPDMMIHPRWYHVVDDLMDEAGPADRKAVEELLEENASVPPALRDPETQLEKLYPGRTQSDARARLVGHLVTHNNNITASKLKRLLLDEHGCNIEAVQLRKKSELKVLLEVLDQASFQRLRALELYVVPDEEQLEQLGSHPKLAGLETLIIRGKLEERFATLSRLPLVARLRHLGLWYALDRAPRKATDALAAVGFANLYTFVLSAKNVRASGNQGRPFMQAPWIEDLHHFALDGTTVGDDDIDALAERSNVGQLESLSLDQGRASKATVCKLLSKLSGCTHLNLRHFECDGIGDPWGVDVAEALVSSGCVPNLINLFVGFTDEATQVLRANGLDDLAARNRLEQLRGWRL